MPSSPASGRLRGSTPAHCAAVRISTDPQEPQSLRERAEKAPHGTTRLADEARRSIFDLLVRAVHGLFASSARRSVNIMSPRAWVGEMRNGWFLGLIVERTTSTMTLPFST
jgi:hypothetical protein